MKLHRLEVQALQAFAGREEVDFDALAAGGLFLLHGDTGAGKTTLLDAVVLALYGTLPGAREKHARERSDHADPAVETRVVLEATLRGERVRITRWPRQERPKQRGAGTVEQAARVQLDRRDASGAWELLSAATTRPSAELDRLLGMSREQFCQVVLLPQGEFATFLRAGSDERWAVLERLFATERFRDAEEWFARRRREVHAERDAARVAVRDVANRLAQQTEAELPAGWGEQPETLVAWTQERLVGAEAGSITGQDACAAAAATRDAAEAAVRRAEKLAGQQARRAEDEAALARLEEARPQRRAAGAELGAARRAVPLLPLLDATDRARTIAATARVAATTALEAVAAHPVEPDLEAPAASAPATTEAAAPATPADPAPPRPDAESQPLTLFDLYDDPPVAPEPGPAPAGAGAPARLRQTAARVRKRAGEVGALAGIEAELDAREADVSALEAEAASARAAGAAAAAELAGAPAARTALVADYEAALEGAAALEERGRIAAQAQARLSAARERDALAGTTARLEAAERTAADAELATRSRWLDVRQARVEGMAAELAGHLLEGEQCPVCGASEHPAPARPGPVGATSPEAEDAARVEHERAEHRRDAARRALAEAHTALAGARATAGAASLAELRDDAATAEKAHARARRAAGQLQAAGEARDRFDAHAAGLHRSHQAATAQVTALATRAVERRTELEADRAELRAALGVERRAELDGTELRLALGLPATAPDAGAERRAGVEGSAAAVTVTVAGRVADLERRAGVRETAADAVGAAERAEQAADEATARAGAAAFDAGFATLPDAADAARPPERVAGLEARVRRFDEQLAAAQAVLADLELAEAATLPPPDLPPLRAAARRAAEESARVEGAVALARRDAQALKGLERRLGVALDALGPLEARAAQVRDLATLVDGTAAANAKRMRLSAYVLAARLEEIAAAATVRLTAMSGGRYALEHSDERTGGRGRPRGGLDLRVVDAWTGRARHPATLSGGETFMASLALALGLADVVAAESGGARLETLFVDEGFGSLDDTTLDEVLDVLDALRAGGRAVGIVSHVGELRQRVGAQLHVVKGRTGSTVRQSVVV